MLFLFKFKKKKLHLSGHYIFSIKFETFLQTLKWVQTCIAWDCEVWSVVLFLLAIVLSVLQYTDSDYPFGIFKLFFEQSPEIFLTRSKNLFLLN
jgi:hypothetical protein